MLEIDPVIGSMFRYGLAALFISACLHKLFAWQAFVAVLANYRLCPDTLKLPVAALLIGMEGMAGVMALFFASEPYAFMIMLVLLGVYSLAIALNLLRGRTSIDCGCSGAGVRQILSGWLLVRNSVLIAFVVLAMMPSTERDLKWFDGWIVAAGIAVLALLYAAVDQLIANRSRLGKLKAFHA